MGPILLPSLLRTQSYLKVISKISLYLSNFLCSFLNSAESEEIAYVSWVYLGWSSQIGKELSQLVGIRMENMAISFKLHFLVLVEIFAQYWGSSPFDFWDRILISCPGVTRTWYLHASASFSAWITSLCHSAWLLSFTGSSVLVPFVLLKQNTWDRVIIENRELFLTVRGVGGSKVYGPTSGEGLVLACLMTEEQEVAKFSFRRNSPSGISLLMT